MNAWTVFGLLIVAHALADYPLQGDFLARAKNPMAPITGVPWYQALAAHSIIQAGFVWVITGSALFGAIEFLIHGLTDYAKCTNRINFNADQAIHIGCKAVFAIAGAYI